MRITLNIGFEKCRARLRQKMSPRDTLATYSLIDKTGWVDGPWIYEPDKVQWLDEITGLPCLIVRNHHGALCGYVGVSAGHKYFGKKYDDVDGDVHGGLTFSGSCQPNGRICHVVDDGEDVWWLGFDCAHAFDLAPRYESMFEAKFREAGLDRTWEDVYRDLSYVKGECRKLAAQLAAA